MKTCSHCGKMNENHSTVCVYCGNAIGTDEKLYAHLRNNKKIIEEMRSAQKIGVKMPRINWRKLKTTIFILIPLVFIAFIINSSDEFNINSLEESWESKESTEMVEGEETTLEYVLLESNSRYLSSADLEGLSAEQLRIARNEIYARHGRRFNDAGLQAYFDSLSWYSGTISPEAFTESLLNEYEVANRDLIVSYETSKGYR